VQRQEPALEETRNSKVKAKISLVSSLIYYFAAFVKAFSEQLALGWA
jgi:hypothetical protein